MFFYVFSDRLKFFLSSLVILFGCLYWRYLHNIGDYVGPFLFSSLIIFSAYLFCVYCVVRGKVFLKTDLWWIFLFAILFRLSLLSMFPSDDIYRYLWEGKLLGLGISPYSFSPDSEALVHLRDSFYQQINHKDFSSIYPPVCQYVFAFAVLLSYSVVSMKLVFIFFDILTIIVLLLLLGDLKQNYARVVIYAYNPLVIFSVAAHGHNEPLFIFFLFASILAFRRGKSLICNILLGASFLSKFIFVFFWPFYIRETRWRYSAAFVLSIFALSLPLLASIHSLFDVLFRFGGNFRYNDSLHFVAYGLFRGFYGRQEALFMAKLIVLPILLFSYIYYFRKSEILEFGYRFTAVLLLFMPTVHPWYLLWLIPFLVFFPNRAWILLSGTMFSYFIVLRDFNQLHVWRENHWAHAFIYVPFFFFLLKDFIKSR